MTLITVVVIVITQKTKERGKGGTSGEAGGDKKKTFKSKIWMTRTGKKRHRLREEREDRWRKLESNYRNLNSLMIPTYLQQWRDWELASSVRLSWTKRNGKVLVNVLIADTRVKDLMTLQIALRVWLVWCFLSRVGLLSGKACKLWSLGSMLWLSHLFKLLRNEELVLLERDTNLDLLIFNELNFLENSKTNCLKCLN